MRRAAKVDRNHAEIVAALRQVPGLSVYDASRFGGGFPDLVVGWKATHCWLMEVKAPGHRTRLTAEQMQFRAAWTGPYAIVTSPAEALEVVGEYDPK
jgi:hypothetical protein